MLAFCRKIRIQQLPKHSNMPPKEKLKLSEGQGCISNFFSKTIVSEKTHTDEPSENQSNSQICPSASVNPEHIH